MKFGCEYDQAANRRLTATRFAPTGYARATGPQTGPDAHRCVDRQSSVQARRAAPGYAVCAAPADGSVRCAAGASVGGAGGNDEQGNRRRPGSYDGKWPLGAGGSPTGVSTACTTVRVREGVAASMTTLLPELHAVSLFVLHRMRDRSEAKAPPRRGSRSQRRAIGRAGYKAPEGAKTKPVSEPSPIYGDS